MMERMRPIWVFEAATTIAAANPAVNIKSAVP
jgi:hypothetical protein